jgi:hypothetical protein
MSIVELNNIALNMLKMYYERNTISSLEPIRIPLHVPEDTNPPQDCIDDTALGNTTNPIDFIQKPPSASNTMYRYISLNGFDRDWRIQPKRFAYSIGMQSMYRDVQFIQVTSVVIPAEINDTPSLNYVNKTSYLQNYRLDVPYIILRIEEFADMYEPTNPAITNAFCTLIADKYYQTANGRGYVVLVPMQNEYKVYSQSLVSFSRLSISLLRPNGLFINNSEDTAKIFKVEYEPFNPLYLKIVTCAFFDKNEFFKGDFVMLQGFMLSQQTDSSAGLCEYINRQEGHEIKEIGRPNEDGFHRWFHIDAPSMFDSLTGKMIIDKNKIDAIVHHNSLTTYDDMTPIPNGIILNTSLQASVAVTVGVNVYSDTQNKLPSHIISRR